MAITGEQALCGLWCSLYPQSFSLINYLEFSMIIHALVCIQLACMLMYILQMLGSKLVFPCLVATSFMGTFGTVYAAINY